MSDTSLSPRADDQEANLTQRSLRWLVLTALIYRVGVTVPAILLNRDVLFGVADGLLLIGLSVLMLDAVLIGVTIAHSTWLATRPVFFALDMTVALGTTIGATLLLPPGMFLISGADLMTGFGWGTIGLWTVARGWRTGLCLVAAMPVVQLAMAVLNGAPLDGYGVSNIVFRSILGLINFVVPFLIYLAARRTARAIIEEARRAGDLAERVAALRSLHDSAIADLDAIVLIAGRDRISVAERFRLIAEAAEGQAALLATTHGATAGGSAVELIAMVTAFAQRGLPVELSGPVSILDGLAPAVQEALLNASREALHNCLKYSGAPGAALRIRTDHHDVEIEIRDQGMGFAPGQPVGFGIEESISSRLRAVGGEAVVTSKAGSGTSVLLRVAEGANTPRQSDIAVVFRWFPIVPLAARLFVLPLALYKTEPLLAGNPVDTRA